MRYKDIKMVEARVDYHYGLDPEMLVYTHKVGDAIKYAIQQRLRRGC